MSRQQRPQPADVEEGRTATIRVVRMYGSQSYYGVEPRQPVWDAARTIASGPDGRSLFVALGAPLDWVFEAARLGRAHGQLMLEAMFGDRGADTVLEQRLNQVLTPGGPLSGC